MKSFYISFLCIIRRIFVRFSVKLGIKVFLRNFYIRKGSYFLSLLMFVGIFCLKIFLFFLNINFKDLIVFKLFL